VVQFQKILSILIESLFPHACCSCGSIGPLICDQCYNLLEFVTTNPEVPQPLASITSAVVYTPPIQKLIHQLKFAGIKDAGLVCARIIYFTTNLPNVDVITSVPLHESRKKVRGYNQAEVIARELAVLTNVPYQDLIERCRATQAQAQTKSRDERQKNLAGAFGLLPNAHHFKNSSILIVDDVFTTGATFQNCAQVLQQIEPIKIHGVTLTTRS
jgi:ComF family protein